jgi:hypothetical protein
VVAAMASSPVEPALRTALRLMVVCFFSTSST